MASLPNNHVEKASTKSQILEAPDEVISLIVTASQKEDLPMLRLTCKRLCIISTLPFARTLAKTRRFKFTQESLEAFVGLTAHPAFAPLLKVVTFSTHFLTPTPGAWYRFDKAAARHDALAEMQSHFIRGGSHIVMLTKAFENLKQNGDANITIGIHSRANESSLPESADPVGTLQAITNASKQVNFSVKSVEFDQDFRLGEYNHPLIGEDLEVAPWCLFNTTPDFCLKASMSSHKGNDIAVTKVIWDQDRLEMSNQSFAYHLAGNPYIMFDSFCHYAPNYLGHLLNHDFSRVSFKTIDAQYDELSNFLRWRGLKHLELLNIRFSSYGASSSDNGLQFFSLLRDRMQLESLTMEDIQDIDQGRGLGVILEGKVHWKGTEETKARLDELIAKLETWDWSPV